MGMSRLDDPAGTAYWDYYIRETVFQTQTSTSPAIYEIQGHAPYNFVCKPLNIVIPHSKAGTAESGWSSEIVAGLPVTFTGTTTVGQGAIFLPDGIKLEHDTNPPRPYNQKLLEIKDGRVACMANISMAHTSDSNAVAGFFVRCTVPSTGSPKADEHLQWSKYALYVRKDGKVELNRQPGDGSTSQEVWSANLDAAQLTRLNDTEDGIKLEIRNDTSNPARFFVYVNGAQVGSSWDDPSPIVGVHNGFMALCKTGSIKFSSMYFFNIGILFTQRFTANGDGTIDSDVKIEDVSSVVTTGQKYSPLGLPALDFVKDGTMNSLWTKNYFGSYTNVFYKNSQTNTLDYDEYIADVINPHGRRDGGQQRHVSMSGVHARSQPRPVHAHWQYNQQFLRSVYAAAGSKSG